MPIEKITVKKILEFRRFSDVRKKTLVRNLCKPREAVDDGGDYWISCLSALSNAFASSDNKIVREKIDEIRGKMTDGIAQNTRLMYERNVEILVKYNTFDFSSLSPSKSLKFLKQPREKQRVLMNGLPVVVNPHKVFQYEQGGLQRVGEIWFVTWLDGYKTGDLEIYCECLNRYLSSNYTNDDLDIDVGACVVVDVSNQVIVSQVDIQGTGIPKTLDRTLDQIKLLEE